MTSETDPMLALRFAILAYREMIRKAVSRALWGSSVEVRRDLGCDIRIGFNTFCYDAVQLAESVRSLRANRSWVRRRNCIIDVLKIFGVRIEDRCRHANAIMAAVCGSPPSLPLARNTDLESYYERKNRSVD